MRKIVCLSTSSYYPFPTRKQNVMNRLSDAEVLYLNPPVSLLAPLRDRRAFPALFAHFKKGIKANGHVTVYSLPPVLPFFNKYRFINKINQFFHAGFVRRKIKKHWGKPVLKNSEIILWTYSPTACDIAPRIKKHALVYDCVDRHSAYPGMINPAVVDAMERDLATLASCVFCTAAGLYRTLSSYNKNTHLIPNGVNFALFNKAASHIPASAPPSPDSGSLSSGSAPLSPDSGSLSSGSAPPLPVPEAMRDLPRPIFGFLGMLQECIAYDYIEALLTRIPQCSVVFIGRKLPGVDLSRFSKYPNARFIGVMPQNELPPYIAQFDVCLNVFAEGKLSDDVSPLKFYEYLATGKPTVSTRTPAQVLEFRDVCYIAEDIEDFIKKCTLAAQEDDPALRAARIERARACSWDNRVREMEEKLKLI